MKKKIIVLAVVACLAVMSVVGATLAYLTATDSAKNTFTFGNVDIEILESTLHRHNDKISTDEAGDQAIIDNAKDYQDYLEEHGELMVPGRWVKKAPYIHNIGSNAAYVRLTANVLKDVDDVTEIMLYTTGMEEKAFDMTSTSFVEGGKEYVSYIFTFTNPLEAGDVTDYAPFWQFRIRPDVDNEDLTGLQGVDVVHSIDVYAEAIQAEGFATADEAFAAFDAQEK